MFVAVVASALAARTRTQTESARREARTTAELYAFSRKIAGVIDLYDLLWIVVSHLARLLERRDRRADAGGRAKLAARPARGLSAGRRARATPTSPPRAGRGTPTGRPGAAPTRCRAAAGCSCRSAPAARRSRVIGVLPHKDGRRALGAAERRLLEAVGNQAAVAIERVTLAEDIDQARLGAERERLRSAMLTSVSHDLRTPLASIIGALSSLRSYRRPLRRGDARGAAGTAQSEAERLDRFVGNLLDMTRLDAGAIVPKREAGRGRRPGLDRLRRAAPLLADTRSPASVAPGPAGAVARFRAGRAGAVQPARQCRQVLRRRAAASRSRRRRAGGRVEIVVRDEGPGIADADARPDLREVLSRRRRRSAAGRHGPGPRHRQGLRRGPWAARITARNRSDRSGAEFVVSYPVPDMTADGATILIVEDEPPIRRLLRTTLGRPGLPHPRGRRPAPRRWRRCAITGPTWCCSISACPIVDGLALIGRDPRSWAGAHRRAVEPRRGGGQGGGARFRRRRLRHQAVRRRRADGAPARRAAPPPAAAGRGARLHQRRPQRRPGAPAGASADGEDVKLSPKEYDILEQLVIHAGKVLTHQHLLREVWRDEIGRSAISARLRPPAAPEDRGRPCLAAARAHRAGRRLPAGLRTTPRRREAVSHTPGRLLGARRFAGR